MMMMIMKMMMIMLMKPQVLSYLLSSDVNWRKVVESASIDVGSESQ